MQNFSKKLVKRIQVILVTDVRVQIRRTSPVRVPKRDNIVNVAAKII